VLTGVEAFEAEFGIPVEKQIGPDWEQASENERLEALAAQGFKYFSVYPSDASGANGLYEELTQNGAMVINFGASTMQPTTASFMVATDVKATEALIQSMGGKGNIVNVLEVLEDSNTVLRKEGVEEVVAKYPDVKIIQEISGMTSLEEAVEKIGNVLSANIEQVDGIIATGFTISVGIAQVLGEYYDTGGDREIHAVGIDTDPTVMKAIEDGVMDGTIAQNPYGHGYLSLLALKLIAEGYTPATAFITSTPAQPL
jgi:ribose transport system substrate-binding protein